MTPPPDDVFDGDVPHWLARAIPYGSLAVLVGTIVWKTATAIVQGRAIFSDGFAGITMGGRRFSTSWPDVRETSVEFRVRMGKLEPWRRAVRLDTTAGPLLLHALPTWFERVMLNAKPALSPPPAAPGSGSASA